MEALTGVAQAGEGSSGRGEHSGGGVFPSIWILLKCGEELGSSGGLELEGGAEVFSSLHGIFAVG